jgi:branched-chain amino acid aminotransferase
MASLVLETSTALKGQEFLPFEKATLSIASSPVLYGLSIYTVFSANWNQAKQQLYIFRLEDHYRRLLNSAKIMDFHGFAEQWTFNKFRKQMIELLKLNKVQENVLVRVTVYIDEIAAGTRIHGLKNNLTAYVYPLGEILNRQGINVCVSSWQRTPDNSIPSRAKVNGSYVNSSLMKNEALLNGYDEAIALDQFGQVTEGTVANLFLVKDGRLITPESSSDILEGITRDSVKKLAEQLKINYEERAIDRSELYIVDEMFMCGSSAQITPILSVDKRPIDSGKIGHITQKLSQAYKSWQLGKDSTLAEFITPVY